MRKTLAGLVVVFVCAAHGAMAADDGQTQPKVNAVSSNSHTTATDIIATINGSGNVKGVSCALNEGSLGTIPSAVVKFYVNGGGAQTVTLTGTPSAVHGDPGYMVGHTGWVPFNVRFTSSIRVTIQKASSFGSTIDCEVSWGLD